MCRSYGFVIGLAQDYGSLLDDHDLENERPSPATLKLNLINRPDCDISMMDMSSREMSGLSLRLLAEDISKSKVFSIKERIAPVGWQISSDH